MFQGDNLFNEGVKKSMKAKNQNDSVREKVYANFGNPEVLRHVPYGTGLAILDLGCGAGDNAKALIGRGCLVDGVTLSQQEANQVADTCRAVSVHNLEEGLPEVFKSQRYDCILCSHVLEHICFPEKLLADMPAVLKPGGRVIIALPNLLFIRNRWELLRGRFIYQPSGLMDNTHFRWYTYETCWELLQKMDLEPFARYATGYLPFGPIRRSFSSIFEKIEPWLCSRWPGLFGYQLILVGQNSRNFFR
jgi:2-polyprenyl-3-methyl-5-hydroxy-6-metoxy-1,4-benzoquinol methylase